MECGVIPLLCKKGEKAQLIPDNPQGNGTCKSLEEVEDIINGRTFELKGDLRHASGVICVDLDFVKQSSLSLENKIKLTKKLLVIGKSYNAVIVASPSGGLHM